MKLFFLFCILFISCNSMQLQDNSNYPQSRHLQATADPFPFSMSKPAQPQLDSDYFDDQYDAIRGGMIKTMLALQSFVISYTRTTISTRKAKTQNFTSDISKVQGKLNDLAASLASCPMRFSSKLRLNAQSSNLLKTYGMLSSDLAIILSGGDPTKTRIYTGAAYGIGLADGTPIQDKKINPFDTSLAEQAKDIRPVNPFSVPTMSMFSVAPPSAPTVVLAQNMEVNTPSVSDSAQDAQQTSETV